MFESPRQTLGEELRQPVKAGSSKDHNLEASLFVVIIPVGWEISGFDDGECLILLLIRPPPFSSTFFQFIINQIFYRSTL